LVSNTDYGHAAVGQPRCWHRHGHHCDRHHANSSWNPHHAERCAVGEGISVCRSRALHRRVLAVDHAQANCSPDRRPYAHHRFVESWWSDLRGSVSQFSWSWSASSNPELGKSTWGSAGAVLPSALVAGGFSWSDHRGCG